MSIPEWLDQICVKKTNWGNFSDEDKKSYNQYIINLWLSMEPKLIEILNDIQKYTISDKNHYNFLKKSLPKKKIFLRWIRAKKSVWSKDVINELSCIYELSSREVYDVINMLSNEQIENILKQKGLSIKEIKKILK